MHQRNNKLKIVNYPPHKGRSLRGLDIMKVNVYMAIMSHLSDAQYFIDDSTKSGDMARQLINLAKMTLFKYKDDIKQDVDTSELVESGMCVRINLANKSVKKMLNMGKCIVGLKNYHYLCNIFKI